jgi:hypothetical protein
MATENTIVRITTTSRNKSLHSIHLSEIGDPVELKRYAGPVQLDHAERLDAAARMRKIISAAGLTSRAAFIINQRRAGAECSAKSRKGSA